MNHIVRAVDAQLQWLHNALRVNGFRETEQTTRERIVGHHCARRLMEPLGVTRDAVNEEVKGPRQRLCLLEQRRREGVGQQRDRRVHELLLVGCDQDTARGLPMDCLVTKPRDYVSRQSSHR